MDYLVSDIKFGMSYKQLKSQHELYCMYNDEDFLAEIADIIHLACIISYLKELSNIEMVSDRGIIHQLVHLLTDTEGPSVNLEEIRKQFEEVLKLS